MKYYSVLKRYELSSHEEMWRKLRCILLSERRQSEKATYCMFPTLRHSGKGKTIEIIKRSVVSRGRGEGGMNRWSTEAFRGAKMFCMLL